MATIIGSLPVTLTNGTTADATQVMSNFSFIVSQANANAAHSGANSDITSLNSLSTPLSTGQGGTGSAGTPTGLQNLGVATVLGPTFISGLGLTFSSTTKIAIAEGAAVAQISGSSLLYLSGGSKTVDLSASGTINRLDTGALASNTTYHLFLIGSAAANDQQGLASLSPVSPSLPTGYTQARRVGSVRTAISTAAIMSFTQVGNAYIYTTPVLDASNVVISTAAAQSLALSIPTGVVMTGLFNATLIRNTADANIWFSSFIQTDTAAGGGVASLAAIASNGQGAGQFSIITNTSGQIRHRSAQSGSNLYVLTLGWTDARTS